MSHRYFHSGYLLPRRAAIDTGGVRLSSCRRRRRGKRHHACPYSPAPSSVPRNRPTEILTVRRPASSASRCILTLVVHGTGHPCSRFARVRFRVTNIFCTSRGSRSRCAVETFAFNSAVRGTGSVDKVRASVCARPECSLTGMENERR